MSSAEDLRKPILPGKGASDYERYLRSDELLSLQKNPDELLHKDEMTFQVVHQSSELLLKGAAFELDRVLAAIQAGDAVMVKGSLGSRMGPIVRALERQFPMQATLNQAPAQG